MDVFGPGLTGPGDDCVSCAVEFTGRPLRVLRPLERPCQNRIRSGSCCPVGLAWSLIAMKNTDVVSVMRVSP